MDWKELADNSRVWVYQSNRELSDNEVQKIKAVGDQFIKNWATHGKSLNAAFEVFYNRFIILFVDEAQASASGCSIDSSVHFVQSLEKEFNLDLFDRMQICYRHNGIINSLSFNNFKNQLENGKITANTIVFNNLVESKTDFENLWEVPINKSWHKQLV